MLVAACLSALGPAASRAETLVYSARARGLQIVLASEVGDLGAIADELRLRFPHAEIYTSASVPPRTRAVQVEVRRSPDPNKRYRLAIRTPAGEEFIRDPLIGGEAVAMELGRAIANLLFSIEPDLATRGATQSAGPDAPSPEDADSAPDEATVEAGSTQNDSNPPTQVEPDPALESQPESAEPPQPSVEPTSSNARASEPRKQTRARIRKERAAQRRARRSTEAREREARRRARRSRTTIDEPLDRRHDNAPQQVRIALHGSPEWANAQGDGPRARTVFSGVGPGLAFEYLPWPAIGLGLVAAAHWRQVRPFDHVLRRTTLELGLSETWVLRRWQLYLRVTGYLEPWALYDPDGLALDQARDGSRYGPALGVRATIGAAWRSRALAVGGTTMRLTTALELSAALGAVVGPDGRAPAIGLEITDNQGNRRLLGIVGGVSLAPGLRIGLEFGLRRPAEPASTTP